MTQQQQDIMGVLGTLGPLSQHGIIHAMLAVQRYTSPSGIRTRVSELERKGYIGKTGEFEYTPTGRKAAMYRAHTVAF